MTMAFKDMFSRPNTLINAYGHIYIYSFVTFLIQYLVDHTVYEDGAMVCVLMDRFAIPSGPVALHRIY